MIPNPTRTPWPLCTQLGLFCAHCLRTEGARQCFYCGWPACPDHLTSPQEICGCFQCALPLDQCPGPSPFVIGWAA